LHEEKLKKHHNPFIRYNKKGFMIDRKDCKFELSLRLGY